MTLAKASDLLAEEYPEIAFSPVQLKNMCNNHTIPCIEVPNCGLQRKYRHMVHYPTLVRHLKGFLQTAIS